MFTSYAGHDPIYQWRNTVIYRIYSMNMMISKLPDVLNN